MTLVAGIDEAGYGPLMGPLVVSSAAFRVPDEHADSDLWTLFRDVVERRPSRNAARVRVADSKVIYNRRNGLGSIEKHVLPFVALVGPLPGALGEFVSMRGGRDFADLGAYPWYRDADAALPRKTAPGNVRRRSETLRDGLAAAGVEFCDARFELMDVLTYNREVAECGNKSLALSRHVGALMLGLWDKYGEEGVRLSVDKQGGRKVYGPFLRATFPDCRVSASLESAERSEYTVVKGNRRMGVRFEAKADRSCLPTALASMLSKYTREVFISMLNDFWSRRVPGLQPSAGYVSDGRRFLADIEAARRAEGIPLDLLVRCR